MSTPLLIDPNARFLIGHRGARAKAPENTMESLVYAMEAGVDALEFDVRVTRDGVAVLIHDDTVERTTNGRGRVADNSLGELQALDASRGCTAWTNGRVAIPTLEQVLDKFRGVPLIIDVKEVRAVDPVLNLVPKFGLQGSVVLGSDDPEVCARLYRSGISCCASVADCLIHLGQLAWPFPAATPDWTVLSITPRPKDMWLPIPIVAMAQQARRMGRATHVWTVNDPIEAAKYWKGGVAGLISDDPAAILSAKPK